MKHIVGDITDVQRGYILQQVNCQNTMGSGVARALFGKWPQVKIQYHQFSEGNAPQDLLGRCQVIRVTEELRVVNLFSQETYGRVGKHTNYDALDDSLRWFYEEVWCRSPVGEVHHPLIGSGLGGGHWPVVREIIKHRVRVPTTLWTTEKGNYL